MAYRREDIERVRATTDLVELVAEVTKIKRSGRSVMAVCPFHQEKTASMSIDPARGLYHCFGCGKSGDLFRFVQEMQTLDFSDAVELLARRAGVTLHRDPDAAKRRSRRQALVDATEAAIVFYNERLRRAPDASSARRYLRGRGYESEVVTEFRLGYSPSDGDALVQHLRDAKVPEEVAISAGLAIRSRTGRAFDRFRGRIMFPIFDVRGDPVGFGARLLDGDGPKYLNSPETAIYHKSQLLYGLNWSKSAIVRDGTAVVVEGYTDVIGLLRAGVGQAVATCGTALGADHLDMLRRFTEKVVLMFDADEAGATAALRGFAQSVPGDLDLRVAMLDPGRDPAEIAAAGEVDALNTAIEGSVPLLQFRIEKELDRFDMGEPEARGRAVRAAAVLVARHPDAVTRHEYGVFVARRTGVEMDVVRAAVDDAVRRTAEPEQARQSRPTRLSGEEKAEREFLRLMLANHVGIRPIEIEAGTFGLPEHAAAFELLAPALEALDPGVPPDLGSLLGGAEDDIGGMLSALALVDRPLPDPDEIVRRLKVGALDRRIDDLERAVNAVEPDDAPEDYSEKFAELIALQNEKRELWGPE